MAQNLTPLRQFLRTGTGGAAVLLAATVTALAWVNIDASSYEDSADLSGVSGTPTFFINGRRHHGAYDIDSLSAAVRGARIRAVLDGAGAPLSGGQPRGAGQPREAGEP